MGAVNAVDGIKYGFRLLGYLVGVVIAGGLLILIGTGFSPGPYQRGNPALVMIFVLAGMAVIYAGGLGLLYKVIADGVQVGSIAAERGGPINTHSQGFGGNGGYSQQVGQQPQGQYAPQGNAEQGTDRGDTVPDSSETETRPGGEDDEDRTGN